ncbi:hypothetical protein M440DRAFT_1472508 [Trichoderma longibrachiatum ATCC 18648]|uniref:DNA2/NAM7 helicase helicase domain-containing protein n=1 Tax=Trichoderma longibrachiatum ATCC 18648 TaxID=983965 RepID=A0A2T4BVG3_TRILO|nr:hypothetical protein M440DRAFT_1472508 [Trichoderma longibrachiatum ATCC 18648]
MRHTNRRRRGIRAPAGCFVNQEHRKNTLIKGLTNELKWANQVARECQETTFEACLLPMPGSDWAPRETDMEVFGIPATNEPRAYLMILDLKDIPNLLPSIGSVVQVDLEVDQIFHVAPKLCLEGDALERLATEIQRGLDLAERKACDAIEGIFEILRNEGCEDDKIRSVEVMKSLTLEHYRVQAKKYLYNYNANLSDEAIPGMPSADTETRRMYDADRFASELRKQRIKDWIQQEKVTSQTPMDTYPLVGHRIKLPPGTTADAALFVLEVPLQPYWPDAYQNPPVTLGIPKRTWPTDSGDYLDGIIKGLSQASFLMEDWAVEKMSRLQEESPGLGNDWWNFSTRFVDIPTSERIDLLKWYPTLTTQLGEGIYEGEYAQVVETMSKSRAGKVIINAPAGPKRTSFALSVTQAKRGEEKSRHVQDTYVQFQMAIRKKVDEFVPDEQVDKAAEQLIAMNPDKIILRVYSYSAEVHNLTKSQTESALAGGRTRSETNGLDAYNSYLQNAEWKRKPASNKHSWSEQCLSRGHFVESGSWSAMNPTERSKYWSDAEAALEYLLDRADVVCTTPSAFHKIYKRVGYSGWEPSLIIVDNANQLTETASLLPIASFPDVPALFIGDLEQDGPEVMASEQSLRTSTATKRRTRSLLQRVEDAGYLDCQLFPGR